MTGLALPPRRDSRRFAVAGRCATAAFGGGLLVALATSAGIAGERITEGDFGVALAANAAGTIVAILALVLTMRPLLAFLAEVPAGEEDERLYRVGRGALVVAQVLGAAAGIGLVHLVLRREVVGAMPWLSERPAQLVNDVVAVSGLLALVWASANRLDTRVLVIALLVMTAYRATASAWHLDHAPHGFQTTIQELVVAQFVAAALGLVVFRVAIGRRAR
jgi:hypothetical protein